MRAAIPGPRRTVGGRITYAGIDLYENQFLRRHWFGKQGGTAPKGTS